jgi:protein-arginine kinase activator protein McsA
MTPITIYCQVCADFDEKVPATYLVTKLNSTDPTTEAGLCDNCAEFGELSLGALFPQPLPEDPQP